MEERDPKPSDPHLSQAYREAAHPEPSPSLDARILEAARQAVAEDRGRKQARKPSRWLAWAVPLSTTAVLVLGLTLLFEVQRQAPEYMEPPGARDSAASVETREIIPQPAEPTQPQRNANQEEVAKQAEAMDSAASLGDLAGQAPAATQERGAAEQRATVSAAPAAPIAAEPQPFPAQAGAVSAPPAAKVEAQAMPAPMADRNAAEAVSSQASPAATLRAAPPAALSAPAQESASSVPFSQAVSKRKAVSVPPTEGPEQRVETIRRLLREGRLDDARTELEKLRRDYPGFALPEDLKGL